VGNCVDIVANWLWIKDIIIRVEKTSHPIQAFKGVPDCDLTAFSPLISGRRIETSRTSIGTILSC
jgi:hypothetical protein